LYDGVDDSTSAGDPPDGSLDFPMTSFSVSMWLYVAMPVGEFDIPLHKGGSSAGNPGYDFELGNNSWYAGLHDPQSNPRAQFGDATMLVGRWLHLVAIVDRELVVMTSYINSVLADTTPIGNLGTIESNAPLDIGRSSFPFAGTLDEVRVYAGALDAAWVAAEYDNIANRASFVAIGPEESLQQK
jgi:hypothetical protein